MTERRCENCEWWVDWRAGGGPCHRGLIVEIKDGRQHWPMRLANDWCGEFKPRGHDAEP